MSRAKSAAGASIKYALTGPLAYPAGSFYVIPAGAPHFSAVLEGEVEFQEGGFGPSSHDRVD